MREDPDIIVVGEIRDTKTAEVALNASLTGHKVVSTIHGGNVEEAMQRLGDLAADLGTSGVGTLAQAFKICVAQQLVVPGERGKVVPLHEILVRNESVIAKIRSSRCFTLKQDMESGSKEGMQTFAQSYADRLATGLLSI
jgi:twitching motility protein PilT